MKLPIDVTLTAAQLAEAFCELDDEAQAQFFIEAARISRGWTDATARLMQWHSVGRHLRTCSCSTDDARTMVQEIAAAIDD